jgi:methylated-DNA-[protein]-cysteine S-methyltransferase
MLTLPAQLQQPMKKRLPRNATTSICPNFVDFVIKTPIGKVGIKINEDALCCEQISFLPNGARVTTLTALGSRTPVALLARKIIKVLDGYFKNARAVSVAAVAAGNQSPFPLNLKNRNTSTPLQRKTWQLLRKIPCGATVTYSDLAKRLHTSPRVVGNACRRNPFPLIIPCHRVVAINGLGGFAGKRGGALLAIKKWLLRHEGHAL